MLASTPVRSQREMMLPAWSTDRTCSCSPGLWTGTAAQDDQKVRICSQLP